MAAGPPQMAVGHLGPGSNVQSSSLMINLLLIGHFNLGLNGRRPFGAGLNAHRPPETVGHLNPMLRAKNPTLWLELTWWYINIPTINEENETISSSQFDYFFVYWRRGIQLE